MQEPQQSGSVPTPFPRLKHLGAALAGAGTLALTACGGGGGGTGSSATVTDGTPQTASLSGVVADGLITGATVCYDLNDNGTCDGGEPRSTQTGTDGTYTLAVPAAEAGKHAVIAEIPATAIDQDKPGQPIGTAFMLKSPPQTDVSKPVFVSPLTTAVADVLAATGGKDLAAATEQVKQSLGLSISPLTNFIALKTSGSDAEKSAAAQAHAYAQVLAEVHKELVKTADAANVTPGDKAALISAVVVNTLGTMATQAADTGGTANNVAKTIVANQGITTATVTTQAAVAAKIATAATETESGAFVTVRDFRYTNAQNWSYRLFTGDGVADANGYKTAHEVRTTLSGGADVPFVRNQSLWDEAAGTWYECPSSGFQASRFKVGTDGSQTANYCRAYETSSRLAIEDVSGKTIKSVVETIRASGLPNHATWGPAPAALASATATFPAGSRIQYRTDNQYKTPLVMQLAYGVAAANSGNSPKLRVPPTVGTVGPYTTWPFAATLEQIVTNYPGDLGSSPGMMLSIRDVPYTKSDGTKASWAYEVGFKATSATGGTARFYLCPTAQTPVMNCTRLGSDTTYAITQKGDARVLQLADFPAENEAYHQSRVLWVERAGAVFNGFRTTPGISSHVRLNKTAWDALRGQLAGVTAHTDPTAPPAPDATGKWMADMRTISPTSFSYRIIVSTRDSANPNTGKYSEIRYTHNDATGEQPFARNSLYWTGAEWYACPDNGVDVGTYTLEPRTSVYCRAFPTALSGFDVDIGGRTLASVLNEMRQYGSLDNYQPALNWGPDPTETEITPTTAGTAMPTFPAGSRLRYQVSRQTAATDTHGTGSASRVMIGAAQATTLAAVLTQFNGYTAAPTLSNTLAAYSFTDAAGATQHLRVGFEAAGDAGGKAKFYKCPFTAATATTPAALGTCTTQVPDTTYAVTAQGASAKVLRFAGMPVDMQATRAKRLFVENGGVWYGLQGDIRTDYSQRLNETAYMAIFNAFGAAPATITRTAVPQ